MIILKMLEETLHLKTFIIKILFKCTLKVILILSLEVVLKMFFEKKIKNQIF